MRFENENKQREDAKLWLDNGDNEYSGDAGDSPYPFEDEPRDYSAERVFPEDD